MAGDALQKFKSSLNRGITAISIKTSSSLEKAKIKTHIESINAEIERTISNVGETAYEIWVSGGNDFSSLEELFVLIKQKKEEIAQLESEYSLIDERDNQILGAQVPEAPEQSTANKIADEGIFCANCGTRYDVPVNFCRKCGNNLKDQ